MSQWRPASIGELVEELGADARDFRNWVDLIEGAIADFEHATKQISEAIPVVSDIDQQRLIAVWATCQGVPEECLENAHRAIETWTRALKLRS
jgi:hypothetical protein